MTKHNRKKAVRKTAKKTKPRKISKLKVIKIKRSALPVSPMIRQRGRPKGKDTKKTSITTSLDAKISTHYFTRDTEDAIVAYNEASDAREKDKYTTRVFKPRSTKLRKTYTINLNSVMLM